MSRNDVAVGTVRLSAMFCTSRAEGHVRGATIGERARVAAVGAAAIGAGAVVAGAVVGAGAGAVGAVAGRAATAGNPLPTPISAAVAGMTGNWASRPLSNSSLHSGPTDCGS